MSPLVALGVASFLVIANGFFVAVEFALVRLRPTQVDAMAADGNWKGRLVQTMHRHIDVYLAACQLGITLASLGLGWIGEDALIPIVKPLMGWIGLTNPELIQATSFALAFSIISMAHIVIGEQAPKSLGIRKPESISRWGAFPMMLFYYSMWPFIKILNGSSMILLNALGLPLEEGIEDIHSGEEIKKLALASHAHGMIARTDHQLLDAALGFSRHITREIMVPRPDMTCLDASEPPEKAIEIARAKGHTRYPLIDGDPDNVVGMVHVKDLMGGEQSQPLDLRQIRRPILFVPEVATIDKALREFQKCRIHLALVVDEFGGIAGLVTLEDVLEELVGPILDEFDAVDNEPEILRWGRRIAFVRAEMNLEDASEELGFEVEETDVDTVGGYVQFLLGRIATPGDEVEISPYRVQVSNMEERRIRRVRFHLASASTSSDEEDDQPPPPELPALP